VKARLEVNNIRQQHDAAIERWLHESVVPVFDRVMSGEEKLFDTTEVFSGLEARYRMRVDARGMG
jgi:hypothetical protein